MDPSKSRSKSQQPLTRGPSSGSPMADPDSHPTQSETRIIQINTPKVIHVSKEDFKEVVQRLTGQPPSSKTSPNNNNAANVSVPSAARKNLETQFRSNKRPRIGRQEMQTDQSMKNQATGGGYGIFQFDPSLGSSTSNYSNLLMPSGTLPPRPRSNTMVSVAPTSSIPPLPSEPNSSSNFSRYVSRAMKNQANSGGVFQFDSSSRTSNYSNLLMSPGLKSMAPGTSIFPPVSSEPTSFFQGPSSMIHNQANGRVGVGDGSFQSKSHGASNYSKLLTPPGRRSMAPTTYPSSSSMPPTSQSCDLFDGLSPTMNQAKSSGGGGAGGIFQSDLNSWRSNLLDWLMSPSSSSRPPTSQSCDLFNGNNLRGSEKKK